jgi:hypothetical protein
MRALCQNKTSEVWCQNLGDQLATIFLMSDQVTRYRNTCSYIAMLCLLNKRRCPT